MSFIKNYKFDNYDPEKTVLLTRQARVVVI